MASDRKKIAKAAFLNVKLYNSAKNETVIMKSSYDGLYFLKREQERHIDRCRRIVHSFFYYKKLLFKMRGIIQQKPDSNRLIGTISNWGDNP